MESFVCWFLILFRSSVTFRCITAYKQPLPSYITNKVDGKPEHNTCSQTCHVFDIISSWSMWCKPRTACLSVHTVHASSHGDILITIVQYVGTWYSSIVWLECSICSSSPCSLKLITLRTHRGSLRVHDSDCSWLKTWLGTGMPLTSLQNDQLTEVGVASILEHSE